MVTLFNCFRFNEEWYLVEMALAEQFLNADGTERLCELYDTQSPAQPMPRRLPTG